MRSLTNLQEKVSRSNDFGTRLRSFLRAGGAPAAVCLILLLCLALSALALHASRSSAIIGQAHQRGHKLLQRSGRGGDRATQARVGSYYRRWQQLKLIAMPHREDLPKLQEHPQEKKSTDDGDASESGSATSGSLFKMKRIRSAADVFLGGSTPSLLRRPSPLLLNRPPPSLHNHPLLHRPRPLNCPLPLGLCRRHILSARTGQSSRPSLSPAS